MISLCKLLSLQSFRILKLLRSPSSKIPNLGRLLAQLKLRLLSKLLDLW